MSFLTLPEVCHLVDPHTEIEENDHEIDDWTSLLYEGSDLTVGGFCFIQLVLSIKPRYMKSQFF